jgi:hypothetical protein
VVVKVLVETLKLLSRERSLHADLGEAAAEAVLFDARVANHGRLRMKEHGDEVGDGLRGGHQDQTLDEHVQHVCERAEREGTQTGHTHKARVGAQRRARTRTRES